MPLLNGGIGWSRIFDISSVIKDGLRELRLPKIVALFSDFTAELGRYSSPLTIGIAVSGGDLGDKTEYASS